jgi:hypothetical protein
MKRAVPVFFVSLFKTSDPNAIIPGQLNALPAYTQLFTLETKYRELTL